jgi:hypothetical protein
MATVDEALEHQSPLNADLRAGVESISQSQVVRFTKYIKLILPVDGYVFWVKASEVTPSALYNAMRYNAVPYNTARTEAQAADFIDVSGSLHYTTDTRQGEDENFALNRVIFTAESEVNDLNAIGPFVMYIAELDGIRFAFSARGRFYKQAGIYHYVGDAVYPDMDPQIVDDTNGFDQRQVVSNSLPIWLSLNSYVSPFGGLRSLIPLYPSFLTPKNLLPPFASVHIVPESTQAIASAPLLAPDLSHSQIVQEHVKLTFWGLRNEDAMNFVDVFDQFSLETDYIGIMNIPTMRDEKRIQSELGTIAMKKTIEYDVNYYQSQARTMARALMKSVLVNYEVVQPVF